MGEKNIKYFQLELLALLFLILLTWGYSIYYGDHSAAFKGSVSVRYDEPVITYDSVQNAADAIKKDTESGDIPSISLWNLKKDVTIANEDGENEIKVDLIQMNGDMLSVEKERLLSGRLALQDEMKECVISKAAAYKLFKSYDVLGMTIMLDDVSYDICGILDTAESRMLIQEEKLTEKYAYMEFSYPMDKETAENRMTNDLGTLTGSFLSMSGFPESRVIIDKDFTADMLKLVYDLPGSFILLLIIISMVKVYRKTSKVPFIHRITLPICILIVILLGWIADIQFHFPERFIPTRWSDFDFWSRKVEELRQYVSELSSILPVSNDVVLREYSCRCIIAAALSIILFIILQIKWTKYLYIDQRNGGHIWIICLCTLTMTFLSMYALYLLNMAIKPTRGYITIFLGYVFTSLLARWLESYINRLERVEAQLRR